MRIADNKLLKIFEYFSSREISKLGQSRFDWFSNMFIKFLIFCIFLFTRYICISWVLSSLRETETCTHQNGKRATAATDTAHDNKRRDRDGQDSLRELQSFSSLELLNCASVLILYTICICIIVIAVNTYARTAKN